MKKLVLISDIHGNLNALEAVLADISKENPEEIWCLGDIVGYGANPSECIRMTRSSCSKIIGGNHDLAAAEKISFSEFSYDAKIAGEWTIENITAGEKDFLGNLEPEEKTEFANLKNILLSHGSPTNPIWDYVFSKHEANRAFYAMEEKGVKICFIGHSHIPVVAAEKNKEVSFEVPADGSSYNLKGMLGGNLDGLILLNPGSVGQPRDYDWRASYAVINEDFKFEVKRVEYDVDAAAGAILEAGLPVFLARRLRLGS